MFQNQKRKQISAGFNERSKLNDRMDHKPNELSGGQQQRVAIARALAVDPEILLADEPTGNLDSKSGATVMQFLQELHKKGKTIVMVTHDDHLAQFADRIEVLKDGEIVKSMKCYHKDGKNYCEEIKTDDKKNK